jgi:alkylation response protein AidB-like acyl-CoA dehydrogenase
MNFVESEERRALRAAVSDLAKRYGAEYMSRKARAGEKTTELWQDVAKHGYLGVNVPEEYGGGGGGIGDLAAVLEELCAQGCGLLLMVVSPAICATIITRYGTDEQKQSWLPRFADGSVKMVFAITEPDAGSNAHKLTTTGRREDGGWVLSGQKVFISGVDEADAILVVGRTVDEHSRQGRLKPALYIVPTDAAGLTFTPIEMDIVSPEKQFQVFLDDVRLPYDALVGSEDAALLQLFAGLNPERIMGASLAIGMGRFALAKAVDYAKTRVVWNAPIGSHQGIAHPLAEAKIELELAKLMTQKAAALYEAGDDVAAGEAANMAKYAAAEASIKAVDAAVQVHGGNGMTVEYGLAALLTSARAGRIAPVSREMVLNFVAQNSLGLPKSY